MRSVKVAVGLLLQTFCHLATWVLVESCTWMSAVLTLVIARLVAIRASRVKSLVAMRALGVILRMVLGGVFGRIVVISLVVMATAVIFIETAFL